MCFKIIYSKFLWCLQFEIVYKNAKLHGKEIQGMKKLIWTIDIKTNLKDQ